MTFLEYACFCTIAYLGTLFLLRTYYSYLCYAKLRFCSRIQNTYVRIQNKLSILKIFKTPSHIKYEKQPSIVRFLSSGYDSFMYTCTSESLDMFRIMSKLKSKEARRFKL